MNAALAKLAKAAQVPRISFHGLRHSAATALLANGIPAHVAAARLGHAPPMQTLSTYAHVTEGLEQAAADVMERGGMSEIAITPQLNWPGLDRSGPIGRPPRRTDDPIESGRTALDRSRPLSGSIANV